MRRPSVAALVALGFTPEQAKTWREWVENHPTQPKRALALAAEMLPDGDGPQYLRWGDDEYPHQVYYVSRADPYVPTLLWTRGTHTFRIGRWGDIAERHNTKWGVVDVAAPKLEAP